MAPEKGKPMHRSFAADEDRIDAPGPTFDITFKTKIDNPVEGEDPVREVTRTFHCLADIPAGAIDSMLRTRSDGIFGKWSASRFIRQCLVQADEVEWDFIMNDKEVSVSAGTIQKVFDYLLQEAYMLRPTAPPSGSPDGRSSTEDGSTEGSPSPDSPEPVSVSASSST